MSQKRCKVNLNPNRKKTEEKKSLKKSINIDKLKVLKYKITNEEK